MSTEKNSVTRPLQPTTPADQNSAQGQAARLESVNAEVAVLLRSPSVAQRLRAAGPDEWSAVQILGHMIELIPYWMRDARRMAAATGEPPQFGRGLDAPERLEGVQRAATSDPEELLHLLEAEIRTAATDIRGMSAAARAKTGIHNRRGEVTVADTIRVLIVEHAEDHVQQLKQVLDVAETESHKRIVRRVYEEFTNQRRLELADELFSPAFVDHGAPAERRGAEGVKETMRLFLAAFPDFKFDIEAMIAESDLVHVRGTISGTQLGPYAGIPSTGKHASWSAMDDFRLQDGKIVERWTERNRVSQLRQLRPG